MGVFIVPLKLGKRVSDVIPEDFGETDDDDKLFPVFEPKWCNLNHLTVFPPGIYEAEKGKECVYFSAAYFYEFRDAICQMCYEQSFVYVRARREQYIGLYFFEMIYFSDCEGSFDYVVADKLYKDFRDYQLKASEKLSFDMYQQYMKYMKCLKEVVDLKGVIFYY